MMAVANKKIVFFYGTADIYSQFHPCKFYVDGFAYNCAEQYMMHQKAILFKDDDMAEKIIKESVPKIIKSYGRKVKNFDEDTWQKHCREFVYNGNLAKFSQSEEFKNKLLSTGEAIIAEASPRDTRWGIGLGKTSAKAQDPSQWRGKNWLGEALMKVRKQLQEDSDPAA